MAQQDTIEPRTESAFIRGAGTLADFLGVHEITVRKWMRQHRIPYIKLGGAVLFRRSEIDALLERHTVPAVSSKRARKAV